MSPRTGLTKRVPDTCVAELDGRNPSDLRDRKKRPWLWWFEKWAKTSRVCSTKITDEPASRPARTPLESPFISAAKAEFDKAHADLYAFLFLLTEMSTSCLAHKHEDETGRQENGLKNLEGLVDKLQRGVTNQVARVTKQKAHQHQHEPRTTPGRVNGNPLRAPSTSDSRMFDVGVKQVKRVHRYEVDKIYCLLLWHRNKAEHDTNTST